MKITFKTVTNKLFSIDADDSETVSRIKCHPDPETDLSGRRS